MTKSKQEPKELIASFNYNDNQGQQIIARTKIIIEEGAFHRLGFECRLCEAHCRFCLFNQPQRNQALYLNRWFDEEY